MLINGVKSRTGSQIEPWFFRQLIKLTSKTKFVCSQGLESL